MLKPRKKPAFKIGVFSRGRALAHLARGRTIDETVRLLQKRHPMHSFDDVKRVYFPKTGIYPISSMEGKSREEISERYSKLTHNAAAHKKRVGKTMTDLHKNPEFAAAHSKRSSERMTKSNKDPDFVKKRLDGLGRKFEDPKLLLSVAKDQANG